MPALGRQRNDGGRSYAGQHFQNFVERAVGHIHHHVFLVFGITHGIKPEKEFVEDFKFFRVESVVGNQNCLALHHAFHLFQTVGHEGRTGTYDVENTVAETDVGRNLNRAHDDVDIGLDAFLFEEPAQNVGIAGCNGLAVEPLQAGIVNQRGNRQRKTAFGESEFLDDTCVLFAFLEFVQTHDADVGHTVGHTFRNIVIAKVKHLQRKIA